jgi:hypothetical protein
VAQVVELLLYKHEALESKPQNPSPTKKEKKVKEKKKKWNITTHLLPATTYPPSHHPSRSNNYPDFLTKWF